MTNALIHFVLGLLGALIVFVIVARLSGEERFSLPVAPVVIGIACAALAHYISPWATPAVLLLYALASFTELRRDRAAAEAAAREQTPH